MLEKDVLVVLDRDGNLHPDVDYLGKESDWMDQLSIYPGVPEAISRLNEFAHVVVATNQAGVARGFFPLSRVDEIHEEIARRIAPARVDAWMSCPFVGEDYAAEKGIKLPNEYVRVTDLRKPDIGMVVGACRTLGIDLDSLRTYVIGDKVSDVELAINLKGMGLLVSTGDIEKERKKAKRLIDDGHHGIFIVRDMPHAVGLIEGLENRL